MGDPKRCYSLFGHRLAACSTRKISIRLSRTRYGKIKGVRSTTSSLVFGTRPGLPMPG